MHLSACFPSPLKGFLQLSQTDSNSNVILTSLFQKKKTLPDSFIVFLTSVSFNFFLPIFKSKSLGTFLILFFFSTPWANSVGLSVNEPLRNCSSCIMWQLGLEPVPKSGCLRHIGGAVVKDQSRCEMDQLSGYWGRQEWWQEWWWKEAELRLQVGNAKWKS